MDPIKGLVDALATPVAAAVIEMVKPAIAEMMAHKKPDTGTSEFIKLEEVLAILKLSRTAWYAGIKAKKFPKPNKELGAYSSRWRRSEILALMGNKERDINV